METAVGAYSIAARGKMPLAGAYGMHPYGKGA